MIENLLSEMLENYRQVSNFDMPINDDPVLKAELEYNVLQEKVPGSATVNMAEMSIVIDGITVHQVRRLMDQEKEHDLREELAADLLLSVFGTGLNVFRTGMKPEKKSYDTTFGGYKIGN